MNEHKEYKIAQWGPNAPSTVRNRIMWTYDRKGCYTTKDKPTSVCSYIDLFTDHQDVKKAQLTFIME